MNSDDLTNLVIIVAVVALIAYMRRKNDKVVEAPKSDCPPHKWELQMKTGFEVGSYHMCKKCKKIPGQLGD